MGGNEWPSSYLLSTFISTLCFTYSHRAKACSMPNFKPNLLLFSPKVVRRGTYSYHFCFHKGGNVASFPILNLVCRMRLDQKDKVDQDVKADPEDKGIVRGLVERVDLNDEVMRIRVTWVLRVEAI